MRASKRSGSASARVRSAQRQLSPTRLCPARRRVIAVTLKPRCANRCATKPPTNPPAPVTTTSKGITRSCHRQVFRQARGNLIELQEFLDLFNVLRSRDDNAFEYDM